MNAEKDQQDEDDNMRQVPSDVMQEQVSVESQGSMAERENAQEPISSKVHNVYNAVPIDDADVCLPSDALDDTTCAHDAGRAH